MHNAATAFREGSPLLNITQAGGIAYYIYSILLTRKMLWLHIAGWVLDILLGAVDFTRCPSKTVRQHLFGILRDAWQLRPSLQVGTHPIKAAP